MTKANYDLTVRQREDLMMAYREVAPRCHSQREAWIKLSSHPAPRYYVSPKQAFEKLRKMVMGDTSTVDTMSAPRRRMYYSLFSKMQEMAQRKEFIGKSLYYICTFLVGQPAPEFFLSPRTVEDIFSNCKRHGKEYRDMDLRKQKQLASQVNS